MSHPLDPVRVLPVHVGKMGVIAVLGHRFWSEKSAQFVGRAVELRIAGVPHDTALVVSLNGEVLCEVALIRDMGLADPDAAARRIQVLREAHRRERCVHEVAEASVVRTKAEADADFIKQQRDFPRLSNRARSPGLAAHRLRLFNRRQRHTAEAAVQRANERNQQVTARFLSAWGGHVGHPQIISDAAEPTGPAAPRNH